MLDCTPDCYFFCFQRNSDAPDRGPFLSSNFCLLKFSDGSVKICFTDGSTNFFRSHGKRPGEVLHFDYLHVGKNFFADGPKILGYENTEERSGRSTSNT